MLKHFLRPANTQEERDFERANVEAKRKRYLETNPMERFENDAPYRQKVTGIRDSLRKVNGLILDIGGNTAGEATILQQCGYHFVVGDINETALDISRKRLEKFHLKKPYYVALDAHNLPFQDESFSAVTIIEALHHLPSYPQALREIYRVLKPGGRLVSTEPNALDPLRRLSELRDRFRGTIEKSFYVSQLKSLCSEAGFERVDVHAVPRGKSIWKLAEVPLYRRPVARCHGWLSENYPRTFGSLLIEAQKSGCLLDEEVRADDFQRIIRSPVNYSSIVYDPRLNLWVETSGKRGFPDRDGIPVLIATDAVALQDPTGHSTSSLGSQNNHSELF
jgi:ubiquinone/menaquinone biosynthesis C-methylase UbiE